MRCNHNGIRILDCVADIRAMAVDDSIGNRIGDNWGWFFVWDRSIGGLSAHILII